MEVISYFIFAIYISFFLSLKAKQEPSLAEIENSKNQVFMLVSENKSSGTGWIMRTKSGKSITITNRHVCEGNTYMTTTINNRSYKLRILQLSSIHDICILQPVPGVKPLMLSDKIAQDEMIYAVGFPFWPYKHISPGLAKGFIPISRSMDVEPHLCNGEAYSLLSIKVLTASIPKTYEVCMFQSNGYATTIPVDAGSSGSPILNINSQVVGMVMLRQGSLSWAHAVPLNMLKRIRDAN
jgi:S1-C subfamily serine protease